MVKIIVKAKRFLKQYYEKAIQHPKILIALGFLIAVIIFSWFLLWFPQFQVSKFGITNPKDLAEIENSYRATLAQVFGGLVILLGLYFTWKNLVTAKENQITERFTRAIDQLGNEKIEIRLGGIYALERISKESNTDYWAIVKILTAYVREKSLIHEEQNEDKRISTDIQVILEVLFKHEHPYTDIIDLQNVNLKEAQLFRTHLEWVNLEKANLESADIAASNLESAHLEEANLKRAYLSGSNLKWAKLRGSNLERAILSGADLEEAKLVKTNLRMASLNGANLKKATFKDADLTNADLQGTDLREAFFLTPDQLSKARSLYNTKLDEDLNNILRDKYPELFENPLTEEEIKKRMDILVFLGFVPNTRD